ncbi:ankyrin repeat domain-containing protein [bacterium BD-1]|nr:ankyrin repeat domain-containing protein [Ottowia caeni]
MPANATGEAPRHRQDEAKRDVCFAGAFQSATQSIAVTDAIQRWDLDGLLELLRGGAPDHRAGLAALKMAAGENDREKVIELLEMLDRAGVDMNAQDTHGDTALTVAAREGHHEVVALLVEAVLHSGGDLNAPNKYGFTPLLEAAYKGHQKAAEVLIEGLLQSGGDLNAANEYGFTPLTRAAYMARWDVVALLANALHQSGGDVNVSTPGYGTALTLAGEHHALKAMDQLLDAGALATDDDLEMIARLLGFDDAEISYADVLTRATELDLEGVAKALHAAELPID